MLIRERWLALKNSYRTLQKYYPIKQETEKDYDRRQREETRRLWEKVTRCAEDTRK